MPRMPKAGEGIAGNNSYREGHYIQRFLLPARSSGSVIGRSGTKAKAIRAQFPDCKLNIDGDNYPERVVTIAAPSTDRIAAVLSAICQNLIDDFGNEPLDKRPPRVQGGRGSRNQFKDGDFQLCLLIAEHDAIACIGRGGQTIKSLQDESGCIINIHNEFEGGRTTLPGSNERVMSVTGDPSVLPQAIQNIIDCIDNSASKNNPIQSWAMEVTGPCNFFGSEAVWPSQQKHYAHLGGGSANGGLNMGGMNMSGSYGKCIPGMDPMLELLETENLPDGSVRFMANFDRSGSIMGTAGARIKEIRKMSGAFINIDDPQPDSTLREITVNRGSGNEMAVQNAIWLMNIAINAFCDPAGSACPFPATTSMQQVVMSGLYGKPPGMDNPPAPPAYGAPPASMQNAGGWNSQPAQAPASFGTMQNGGGNTWGAAPATTQQQAGGW